MIKFLFLNHTPRRTRLEAFASGWSHQPLHVTALPTIKFEN